MNAVITIFVNLLLCTVSMICVANSSSLLTAAATCSYVCLHHALHSAPLVDPFITTEQDQARLRFAYHQKSTLTLCTQVLWNWSSLRGQNCTPQLHHNYISVLKKAFLMLYKFKKLDRNLYSRWRFQLQQVPALCKGVLDLTQIDYGVIDMLTGEVFLKNSDIVWIEEQHLLYYHTYFKYFLGGKKSS